MNVLEIILAIVVCYLLLLLLLEAIVWKVQPDMEGVVTLHMIMGDTTVKRKLYGLDYRNKLYISSNHWFRNWYHAILENPNLEVERAGKLAPYTAVPIKGDEKIQIAHEYNQGFVLRLLCGFAPQRFLRLDPQPSSNDA